MRRARQPAVRLERGRQNVEVLLGSGRRAPHTHALYEEQWQGRRSVAVDRRATGQDV